MPTGDYNAPLSYQGMIGNRRTAAAEVLKLSTVIGQICATCAELRLIIYNFIISKRGRVSEGVL